MANTKNNVPKWKVWFDDTCFGEYPGGTPNQALAALQKAEPDAGVTDKDRASVVGEIPHVSRLVILLGDYKIEAV